MRKYFLTVLFALLSVGFIQAQKYAYVDTEYIMDNIPEYEDAQKQIEELSVKWQKEIEEKFMEIDALYKKYQNEKPLLTVDMQNRLENEILQKEKLAKDLQKKRFGNNGDLYKRRAELIRPIQDKVYNAIETKAKQRQYVFVFDRSNNANILYADQKIDISNEILDYLGYSAKKKKKANIEIGGSSTPNTVSKGVQLGN